MEVMKTPGVYVVEKNTFPNSVVEVETAMPIFIGYTEKAKAPSGELLTLKPWKINSMNEYHACFGGAPKPKFAIHTTDPGNNYKSFHLKSSKDFWVVPQNNYTFYYNLMLFFANGGGACYIVSVGNYATDQTIVKDVLKKGIAPLVREQEPTMLVMPEAVNLSLEDCSALQNEMLQHCDTMKNRVTLLDVFMDRYPKTEESVKNCISNFRNKVTNKSSYGVAYFPWLVTSVLSDNDITGEMIAFNDTALGFVKYALPMSADATPLADFLQNIANLGEKEKVQMIHQVFLQKIEAYKIIVSIIKESLNLLPPSAAMAGIYTTVDNTRGVWKAPANIAVNSVIKPFMNITDSEQEDMNAPIDGHTVNAIRNLMNSGAKVWGARTLMATDLNYRYINVRRTMIFLEESVKNAARSYVFEPNDANTWLNMKCMIENFLRGVWKRGGLVGSSPEEAFSVHIGLGETMTPEDILEGIMRISVMVAISHPAEFIEITFQQQMQKS